MKRHEYRIGPGAASLMLVVVVVSLSLLSLLALIDARADHKLTQRSIEFAASQYQASAQAEKRLIQIDEILVSCAEESQDGTSFWEILSRHLPEDLTLDGQTISWEETMGTGGRLLCSIEVKGPGEMPRYSWREHAFVAEISE